MYSFSHLEAVCCSMSSSDYCFLTCIQISQEAGYVVWYSHLCQNFPQFIVIHTAGKEADGFSRNCDLSLPMIQIEVSVSWLTGLITCAIFGDPETQLNIKSKRTLETV